jgi:hypothetical protein
MFELLAPKDPNAVVLASGLTQHNGGRWRFYGYTHNGATCDAEVGVSDGADGTPGGGGGHSCSRRPPVDAGGLQVSEDEWLYGGQAAAETETVVATQADGKKVTVHVLRDARFGSAFFVVTPAPGQMVVSLVAYDKSGRRLGEKALPAAPAGG